MITSQSFVIGYRTTANVADSSTWPMRRSSHNTQYMGTIELRNFILSKIISLYRKLEKLVFTLHTST